MVLNGEDKGEFFLVRTEDNDILIRRDDIDRTGLVEGLGRDTVFDGEIYVPLSSIPGLVFRINQEKVSLEITAPSHLFKKQYVDASVSRPGELKPAEDISGFLNYYSGYSRYDGFEMLNVSGELGIGSGSYLGRSTFMYTQTEDIMKAVRLISDLTITDNENLRTITVGDIPASSGPCGSSILLGGLQVARNFSLSPYYLKYPSLSLGGVADTPSEVEVYLNDILTKRESLSPGEFEFNDLPPTGGASAARIVIRDMYGRVHTISTPYYTTDRLLKKGLHEYSYSTGFIRENFGRTSFEYGRPAFLAYHDFGLSDRLKIGYSAEASKDVFNIGGRGLALVPHGGVLNAAFNSSNHRGTSGVSGSLGYSYISRSINITVSLQSSSREYSHLSVKPSDDKPRFLITNSVGFGWDKAGFITAAYTYFKMYQAGKTSIFNASYNKSLTRDISFFVTARETKDADVNREVMLGLRVYLGNKVSGAVSYSSGKGSDIKKASIQKSPPTGTGFGYNASVENTRNRNNMEGRMNYQNRYGMYGLELSDRPGGSGYRVSYAGGMGYIGKSIFFNRPITDSFAKVKVGGLEGVRVYSYNNEIGRTNGKGEIIIPNLQSFNENRIDIEADDIPINYSIRSLTRRITPSFRSGSVVAFDVEKMQAATGSVYMMENGTETPVEYTMMHIRAEGKPIEGMVGTAGSFYVENVPPGTYPAHITFKEKPCRFNVIMPDSEDTIVDLGKIRCEKE